MNARRVNGADGVLVECAPGTGDGQARLLPYGIPNGHGKAELTVMSSRGTFPATITLDRAAAGALIVELLRVYAGDIALPQLLAATETVEWARNSGDGTVTKEDIDGLTECIRQALPPVEMAGPR